MKASITFSDDMPKISIGGLDGVLMHLWGRTEHIFSKDPTDDTIATWFNFFIEQKVDGWSFNYRSNRVFSQDDENRVLENLLAKANQAIAHREAIDLSQEFNALNSIEPYRFGGLFTRMDDRHNPIFENKGDYNKDYDDARAKLREELKVHLTPSEIGLDEHLRNFILQIPLETIWVDHTSTGE
ncbi:MAG: hypothetical protein QM730_20710 [Anaerolineales bacterium]